MVTVLETPTTRKAQAFYATLYGVNGVLTKPSSTVLFLDTTSGAVLGAVESAMAQYLEDMAAGGRAALACGRQEGRQ